MTNYEQYRQVQKQIDTLEEMKESLRADIEKNLPEEGFKDETINVFWTNKKKWSYSPKVESLTAELKATKAKEEEDGTAKAEDVKQLTIKVK